MRKITIMMIFCLITTSINAHQVNKNNNSIESNVKSVVSHWRGARPRNPLKCACSADG